MGASSKRPLKPLKWVGGSKNSLDGVPDDVKDVFGSGLPGIQSGSGNVFEDLGLPHPAERLAKAELARVIRTIVKEKTWTQRRAAAALGIAPPDMSDLMRGKLARFSQVIRLERFLNALDMDIHIRCDRGANRTSERPSRSSWSARTDCRRRSYSSRTCDATA